MWKQYINAAAIDEVLQILEEQGTKARIVAGATDLILEIERGQRQGIDILVDVSRIPRLDQITLDDQGFIHLGPLVTHNHCAGSKLLREMAYPLARATWEVGSPQIRNRGTVAGNLITASPANDTISPLMALGAVVVLRSKHEERIVPLKQFYVGVRKTVMRPDEMLVDIIFPKMKKNQKGIFIKYALRRAQAISVINLTMIFEIEHSIINQASITLGAVAPVIIHAEEAEDYLTGRPWDEEIIEPTASLVMKAGKPINDLRSSARYRSEMIRTMVVRGMNCLFTGHEEHPMPKNPILLRGKDLSVTISSSSTIDEHSNILTRINGKTYTCSNVLDKSLLRLIRENALLTGTKEGCAEGECGACTIFLDGMAVMSCMVPAGRAHLAEITTVEGVGTADQLHPVQAGLIHEGAVQCGYCTPGFVMSGVKLLEEAPNPTRDEIRQAISGNLCRCTGYYKIIQGIEKAAKGGV
jgi:xanthine dehydrogenase iron-sulfur cluster and FAD-binding subunit A